MHEVSIADEPARRVFGVAHRGPYNTIGAAFGQMSELIAKNDLFPDVREMLGVYFDDPRRVPPAELRSLAGVTLREDVALPFGLEEVHLAGGRYARVRVTGSYAGLPAAYDWLYETWLPGSGERDRGTPGFEIYVNSPDDTPEEALITDIYVPLG